MTDNNCKTIFKASKLLLVLLLLQVSACTGQVKEKSVNDKTENEVSNKHLTIKQNTIFPQIHTNLNGMVRQFVRTIHQDRKGNYWFGTNGDGIIRYDGQTLEKIPIVGIGPHIRVLEIVEDKAGNVWFGTSDGLVKYDGQKFETFSITEGKKGFDEEIWGLAIDKNELLWVGSIGGLYHFDGDQFIPFQLPNSMVENPEHKLSDKLVKKIIEESG